MRWCRMLKGPEGVDQSAHVGKTQGSTNTGDPMGDNKRTQDQLRDASNDTGNRKVFRPQPDQ